MNLSFLIGEATGVVIGLLAGMLIAIKIIKKYGGN